MLHTYIREYIAISFISIRISNETLFLRDSKIEDESALVPMNTLHYVYISSKFKAFKSQRL